MKQIAPPFVENHGNKPLAEIAYEQIKSNIINGSFPPGYQAAEQQIALALHMSRTPVHQAIVMLEQEGWVRLMSRKGIQIAPITAQEMRNIYQVLMALESAAVIQLASRDKSDNVIDQRLEAASNKADLAYQDKDLKAWADADGEFHSLLIEGCGNPYLAKMAKNAVEHSQRARLLTVRLRTSTSIEKANEDHRKILQGIFDRRPDEARKALESHRKRGMEVFLPILESFTPYATPGFFN